MFENTQAYSSYEIVDNKSYILALILTSGEPTDYSTRFMSLIQSGRTAVLNRTASVKKGKKSRPVLG